ncbi:MAG: mechanosensitive ion channel domain-containing protein [Chryseolinea sp.]
MMRTLSIGFLFVIGSVSTFKAQQVDSSIQHNSKFLLEMDSIHRADSAQRVMLEHQIKQLKGAGNSNQRGELLSKLKQMEHDDSVRKNRNAKTIERLRSSAVGFPVAPFQDTLFFIYTRQGSFSAADRAIAINEKIEKLYDDYSFKPDSLVVVDSEGGTEIVYGDLVMMSVNEMEALWHSKPVEALAIQYRDILREEIVREREDNSILNIGLRIGALLLVIVGIYILIRLINLGFTRIRRKVFSLKDKVLKGIKFKGYQFLDSHRELKFILFAINVLRLFIILITLYVALPLLFSVFPWTRFIAETLTSWTLSPLKSLALGFVSYLPDLFTILVISTITHYIIKFLEFIAGEIENGSLVLSDFYPDWAKPTLNIVKFLVYAFSFIIIFPHLPGSDSPIFQGVSVFVGILFSLGSSSAIANAVAGLVITYMRPFKKGDRVKIGELSGDVIEKSLLVTRIRTIKNEYITIPNASILSGHTINYTTSALDVGLILHTSVTIGYDVPWKQIHSLLVAAATSTEGIVTDENRQPFVLQTSLDDFYVAYQINAFTMEPSRMAVIYSRLHQNIQDKFNEAGVEIMSPHYRAARDGNTTTIPADYLSKDYKPGSFNIKVDKD